MLEKDIAEKFDETFVDYPLLKVNNRTAGWPDRGIQIGRSVLIWVELKITTLRADKRMLLSNLEREQAAFMYKWSRAGGYCFLLSGVINDNKLLGYAVVRPILYSDWLNVRNRLYELNDIQFYQTMDEMLIWFKQTYIKSDKYKNAYNNANRNKSKVT